MNTLKESELIGRRADVQLPKISLLAAYPDSGSDQVDGRELGRRSWKVLQEAFRAESGWIKVHAAEALLSVDDPAVIHQGMLETETWEGSSRVGFWRVLAQCANPPERAGWQARIEECFVSKCSPYRLTALESLGKLNFVASGRTLELLKSLANADAGLEWPFALWALQLAGEGQTEEAVAKILAAPDPGMRKLAAFVLRWMKSTDANALRRLAEAAEVEPSDSEAYPFMLGAALVLNAGPEQSAIWKAGIEEVLRSGSGEAKYEVCQALLPYFGREDLPSLVPLLDNAEVDVRIAAAAAIGAIAQRRDL